MVRVTAKSWMWSAILAALIIPLTTLGADAGGGEQGARFGGADKAQLDRLARDSKMLDARAVLADFRDGSPETAVIVTLRPSTTADALAAQSQLSARVPEEFTRPGAPVFYDLQDLDIRSRLSETVAEEVDQVIRQLGIPGLDVTQRFSYQFGFAARVTAEALELIAAHPAVIRIEKDGELEAHLRQGLPLMDAETPRLSHNGSGISIAIVDTGIDTSHPRLGGGGQPIFNAKVIGGYDTGDNDSDPRPNSSLGDAHGTACAGIAAGDLGAVGDYIGGVAPGAKLYALKISAGNGGSASFSSMIAGWEWPITHQNDDPANPIRVISTSFGGGFHSGTCDSFVPAMTTAAANAVAAGITIFASSGNDGYCNGMGWPACISYVNSVGAVYDASLGTKGWCVAASSCANKQPNSGCPSGYAVFESALSDRTTAYSNSASFLTLFAPSNDAYTADIVGGGGYSTGDYAPSFGGTSAACPYAAGAAAVLQSAAKAKAGSYLTPAEVRQYLTANGDAVTDGKVAVTKPRINLARAVGALPGGSTGAMTIGLHNPSTSVFYLRNANSSGPASATFGFGPAGLGWRPLTGDWNSNGQTTIGLYSPSTSAFYLRNSNSGGPANVSFGFGPAGSGWRPLTGDWNGNGQTTVGLYSPSTSTFFLRNANSSGAANVTFGFGPAGSGWVPLTGDWNGNGQTTVGLYSPSTSTFYLRNANSGGPANVTFRFGPAGSGWQPLTGDWDGDGITTVGLYSPGTGTFFLRNANSGGPASVTFRFGPSGAGWSPISGSWGL